MKTVVHLLAGLFAAFALAEDFPCMSSCDFFICGYDRNVEVGKRPDSALTSPICHKGGATVGVVHTGEAHLVKDGRTIPISRLGGAIPPTFFRTYPYRDRFSMHPQSAIGCQAVLASQLGYFRGQCWILPVTDYQHYDENGVESNLTAEGDDVNCVSFSSSVE